MQPRRLIAVDLFAGCGGLSVGLRRAGFEIVAAVESDPLAAITYRKNHPTTLVFEQDIRGLTAASLMKRLQVRRGRVDLLAGCPPCQGYSALRTKNGKHRNRDASKDLLYEFLRFVRKLHPKTVMLENVPGLARDARIDQFCRTLEGLGYDWTFDVMDAADYAVPQRRKRMILLASRRGEIELAPPARCERTVESAIGYLQIPKRSRDKLHNYQVERSDKIRRLIRAIPRNGGSRRSLPKEQQLDCHKRSDGFSDIYGRMRWQDPAPTITGGCINPSKGRFLHPTQNRAITLREAALLQGFPGDYVFSLEQGVYSAAQMIGNAFPPEFAARHARKLSAAIFAPVPNR